MGAQVSAARSSAGLLALACAILAACLALAALAPAQSPVPGGTVPSTIELSLGDPTPFTRAGRDVYAATISAEVTATDTPVSLSVADGEATEAPRRGHLVSGGGILPAALLAAGTDSLYRPLDPQVPLALRVWREPVIDAAVRIRLRQSAPRGTPLGHYRKLLLVTLTAGGP